MKKEAVIIGGGLSGLASAALLTENGYQVVILEKDPAVGGLARSFFHDGQWIPEAYHHVMRPDKVTIRYFKQYGLDHTLKWVNSSQSLWYENRQFLLSKPQHLLRFAPLSLVDRLKVLMFGLYCFFPHDWKKLDNERCDNWLIRKIGQNATDLLFKNLMEMKFSIPLAEASTAWLARRLHQSVHSGDWYAYPKGGMQQLVDKLTDSITRNGGQIITGFEVDKIASGMVSGRNLSSGVERQFSAPIIVSSIPPVALSKMYDFSSELQEQFQRIKYKSFISFVFGSDDKRTPYYWNIVLRPQLCFGGIFNHGIFSESEGSEQTYYLFTYTDENSEFYDSDTSTITARYLEDLKKLWPGISVKWSKVFKFKYSQPVFCRNYVTLPIELGVENIYLTGVYRGYPSPRTMDSALYQGQLTAEYIIGKHA